MIVSVLLNKLKERHKEYILVSETLELMSQANENCPLEHVKTYLLSHCIHYHMPVFYLDDYFRLAVDPSEESIRNFDGYGSTHYELTNDKVSDKAYFFIELLNDFEPIQEFDIFAYKRGYHYIANHSVGKFITGEKVIGLTEDRAIELLQTGAIKKLQINNKNIARQSKAPPPPNHINIAPTSQKIIDKVEANTSFMMGIPTAEQGEPKTIEQIINDFRDQITQLTAENNNLNSRLSTARNSYKQHRNEIKELTEKNEQTDIEKAELIKQLNNQADKPAETEPLQGIAKYNADKALFIATGQAIARYIWSMDTTQAIRTGDMVQQLKHVMHSIDPNLLPDDKAIREWLSSIAPDYAKKGGKTPKNAPSEISLIMKK